MKRRFDWRSRLHKALAKFHTQPFEWGKSDCVTFANACVEAMTGESVMAGLEFTPYSEMKGAITALHDVGFESLDDFLSERFPRVHPAYAQEGDIAILDDRLTALGIVLGERIACLTESGYGTVPRRRMKGAFAVR